MAGFGTKTVAGDEEAAFDDCCNAMQ